MNADTILVMEAGRVVAKGTHEELKETNTTYQEIMNSQMREEEI